MIPPAYSMATTRTVWTRFRRLTDRLFRRTKETEARVIVDTLKQVTVFQGLPSSVLRDLADALYVRDYRRDEFLYYEGDPGLGMYIVQRGRIRLVCEEEERVTELTHVGPYECFGIRAVLGDFRRLESAQAISDTRVLGFFSPALKVLMNRSPKSAALITGALARHMAAYQERLVGVLSEREGKEEARRLLEQVGQTAEVPPLQ